MVFDMKYYVVTIAAIFISLGIGIFIGFNMNGGEIYLEHQQQLIDSLENSFGEFRLEKEDLQNTIEELELEKEKQEDFIQKAYYEIIDDKLFNLNIAVIQTSEDYYYDDIKIALQEAGGNVPAQLVYTNKILYLTEEELDHINYSFGVTLTKEAVLGQTNNDILTLLRDGKVSNLLNYLITNDFIRFSEYEAFDYTVDQIILAGGSQKENDEVLKAVDLDLIQKIQNQNMKVVGVERLDTAYSYIPSYKNSGISTIDNVDTFFGRMALILTAAGREGSFGEKEYSDQLVPLGGYQ
ncbi:copper transporter [Clostridium formicaceticum]|uniref:Copper transporter n=1 Tax=Clostridium formicaceticum TaxID=1497 RepID=A0AAC9RNP9_9CLOT|nr:copper transporter [Clostridium formicaceticum]AOY77081.1 hypothetical protein BJL90_15235 [Clostridium formicaceticum]ARE87590.1 hypothetical protein CLFO_19900 [Clostridium formicaceticum]